MPPVGPLSVYCSKNCLLYEFLIITVLPFHHPVHPLGVYAYGDVFVVGPRGGCHCVGERGRSLSEN